MIIPIYLACKPRGVAPRWTTFLVTTLHSFFSGAFFHPFIFKLACALWNARGSGQHATAMSNFGDKAATLVRDLGQSEKGTIPPFNDDIVRAVVDESNEHHRSILRLIHDIQEAGTSLDAAAPEDAAAILVHHQAVLRNKRALLVYLNERADRVRALRWEVGTALPEDLGENLSHSERGYFQQYSALVNRYQGRRGGVGINITLDPTPPREHKVQVRVLEERGELVTRDGTVDLAKNTVHLLWRDEAQPLITEGVVEMVL